MRAGGFAGGAHPADESSLGDAVAGRNECLREVSVERLYAIWMLYHDVASVAAVPATRFGDNDGALGRGIDRGAMRRRDIHSASIFAVEPLALDARRWANEVP